RAARLHVAGRFSAETASTSRGGGIGFNSVSHQLRAVHLEAHAADLFDNQLRLGGVSAGDGAKKLHTITAEAQAYLDAYRPTLDALHARMAEANCESIIRPARDLQAVVGVRRASRQPS